MRRPLNLTGSKIEDLELQLELLKDQQNCLKNRDLLVPSLVVEAPDEVEEAADTYHLSGYVGDDHDGLVIYVNGQAVKLMEPDDGAPTLGPFTYAFEVEVAVTGEADNHHIIEAMDAMGNPVFIMVDDPNAVVNPAMSANGARRSYFIEKLTETELEASRPLSTLIGDPNYIDHTGFLTDDELRLISEWLDIGAQYFNDPFDPAAPQN